MQERRNSIANTLELCLSCTKPSLRLLADPDSPELTTAQSLILSQCVRRAKDALTNLSTNHRDLHGSVSKVGKTVDRVSLSSQYICSKAWDDGTFTWKKK